MNKTKLEERIKTLQDERIKTQTLLVMYDGAIQDNQFWLSQLEKEEVPDGNTDNPE